VGLLGAHVGQLECDEGTFVNEGGRALNGNQLTVDASMFLRKAQCTGEVGLRGARIGGQLSCIEAVFTNPDGVALSADRLTINSDILLEKAQCTGETRLLGARIGGQLCCINAVFTNPGRPALDSDRLVVDGLALNLQRASVTQVVRMQPSALNGGLDLSNARVGVWKDEKRTWPARTYLDGFVYDRIDAPDVIINDRLRYWLPSGGNYAPQPYEQLAGVYRREGHELAARRVAIGKQQARRARARHWSIRWPGLVWSAMLRWTIGYGYRPALVLIPLTLLVLAGSILFGIASRYPDQLHPAKTGTQQPSFNSFRYTMDLLLPVANFKQRDAFIAEGWAAWASFGFTFAGWLLAAIVVAGLSGVFRRN
jgi:hypothetical protein